MKKIFPAMIYSALIIFFMTGCGYDDDVNVVRNGHFNDYPNISVGKAFDQFFVNDGWRSFTSGGRRVVEFKGDCLWWNAQSTVEMQFILTDNKFEVTHMQINEVPMDNEIISGLIYKVMSDYKP